MATDIPINIKRGDTRRHIFVINSQSGSPVDISGWANFALAVSSDPTPVDISTEIGVITGQLLTTGVDGKVWFSPPGTYPAGTYFYDAQATDSNGEKITFAEGTYIVEQDRCKI